MDKIIKILLFFFFLVETISAQTIKPSATQSKYLKIGTGSSCYVSGVMNDPTDPASMEGIIFDVTGTGSLSASSSKTSVVDNNGLVSETITANQKYRLKIKPKAVGYAKITVKYGSASFTINYAASTGGNTGFYWPTGMSDASAAVIINNDYLVVADDETNSLRIIQQGRSGMPLVEKDFSSNLKVSDDMDTESASQGRKYPDHYFFVGSMGQNKEGKDRPDHNRVWAVQNKATSGIPDLFFVTYTDKMRTPLVSWIKAKFGNNAVDEKIAPKNDNGFNIEGFAIGQDYKGYIGFRAPLISEGGKKKALIAPITEFEDALLGKNGKSMNNIASYIENPMLLDLDNRGIRSMEQLDNGVFVIVAGDCGDEESEISSRLYIWTGRSTDAPILLEEYPVLKHKTPGEHNPEGMVIRSFNSSTGEFTIDLIHDKGSTDFYEDKTEAKDLSRDEYKKYKIQTLTYQLPENLFITTGFNNIYDDKLFIYPNPVEDKLYINGYNGYSTAAIHNMQGVKVMQMKNIADYVDVSGLHSGTYILTIQGQKPFYLIKK